MYIFTNILGVFIFDGQFNVIDKTLFNGLEDYKNKNEFIEKLKNRGFLNLKEPDKKGLKSILIYFKNPQFFSDFYNKNLQFTKSAIKNSVNKDTLIMQSVKSIDQIDKAINILAKRAREWYELHNPEFSVATQSHEKFVEGILNKEKSELLSSIRVNIEDSMGADLGQEDIEPIKSLAHQIYDLYQLKGLQEDYISTLMEDICPNTKAVCGFLVAARLIEHAGSLKRLSEMPASTIQILGAEKALFRHMKTGSKPPRHGIIASHPLIAKSPESMHGRTARALADKISIASKIDYFKGKFIGDKLKKEIEEKFMNIK